MTRMTDSLLFTDAEIEAVVAAYPIRRARHLDRHAVWTALYAARDHAQPGPWLLGLVQTYARAVKGADLQYIPGLARWLRDGRHLGDQAEWKREGRGSIKPLDRPVTYRAHVPAAPPDPVDHARGVEALRAWLAAGGVKG